MKTPTLLLLTIAMIVSYSLRAQVSITTDGTHADPSAMLDVKSTDKGFLPPRMTEFQMNAIVSPPEGLMIFCTDCSPKKIMVFSGYYWVNGNGVPDLASDEVFNPVTGRIWKDRNLGASQVATSSTDADAYGDLYQWGRATEGHEVRTSGISSTNATTAVPNDGNVWDGLFITENIYPRNWLTSLDNTLWQGTGGTNNPCPAGFRLPTEAEWEAEYLSWSGNNAAGAFDSPLKLTAGGSRSVYNGLFFDLGSAGIYWSSSIQSVTARRLLFSGSNASIGSGDRGFGFSVRCIKD